MLVLGVYGPGSNSGKTTLIEFLCKALSSDYRIAVIKHAPHHRQLDVPGKDSDKYLKSGAGSAFVVGEGVSLISLRSDVSFENALRLTKRIDNWDLVLVEGFPEASIPKIRIGDTPEQKGTLFVHEDDGTTLAFVRNKLETSPAPPLVELEVAGEKVPLGDFPINILSDTVSALVSSLKGGEKGDIRLIVRRP